MHSKSAQQFHFLQRSPRVGGDVLLFCNLWLSAVVMMGLLATSAVAGPLNPPAGPVTSTYKTLTEVEPRTAINATNTPGDADSLFRITSPGSYYLTGNVIGVVGKHGIEIGASGVTLDLNGFDLVGVPAMGAFDGVSSLLINPSNITILNGSIRNWGGDGVGIDSIGGRGFLVQGVRASGNNGRGIFISSGTVRHCSANGNTGVGIEVGDASTVTDCTSRGNNGGGFLAGNNCSFSGCEATQTNGLGFHAGNVCSFTHCTAQNNLGVGFFVGQSSRIVGCNASENTSNGVQMGDNCTVDSSTINSNSLDGIVAGDSAIITSCNVAANASDGILVGNACLVRDNRCGGTSGASPPANSTGIRVTGNDNRIEGNHLTACARGLKVEFSGNLIISNTATANTINWDISASNFGHFINVTNSGAAFASATGGAALGNTDPRVNISH